MASEGWVHPLIQGLDVKNTTSMKRVVKDRERGKLTFDRSDEYKKKMPISDNGLDDVKENNREKCYAIIN